MSTCFASGTLRRYIDEFAITGLTSNPTIFDHAIRYGADYDAEIRQGLEGGKTGETLFFDLALRDLRQAADLLRPVHERTNGLDGWVSLELSPLLAYDTAQSLSRKGRARLLPSRGWPTARRWPPAPGEGGTARREARPPEEQPFGTDSQSIASAGRLHATAGQPNLFVKIPGTPEGIPAIEEAIFAGVPINVTLLFSREQYLAAAEAYLRGIERRIAAGLNPLVWSVASLFISRWDKAVMGRVPEALRDRLGIAIARRTYKAYRDLLDSPRWLRLLNAGARPQRLMWASTGTKDPEASDVLYIQALAAPFTINTMPEATLLAFAEHGKVGDPLPADDGDCEAVLARFQQAGIAPDALAEQLQRDGAEAFNKSWSDLMARLQSKGKALQDVG